MVRDPQVGIVMTAVSAATKPSDDIRRDIATSQREPGSEAERQCDTDMRTIWFVENLPAIREIYRFDLWLDEKVRQSRPDLLRTEPEFLLDTCVRNPFSRPSGL